MPQEQRGDNQQHASQGRSQKRDQEPWINHHNIDGLHSGNALRRRETGKGFHHEGRKGEENAGYQPAAECRDKGQSEE